MISEPVAPAVDSPFAAGAKLDDAAAAIPRTTRGPRYLRLTINVLRGVGIGTDALCMLLAAVIAIPLYDALVGSYFNRGLHLTGAAVLALNFFLVRISRDAYSGMRGQGDDLGQGAIIDFMLAATLSGITIWAFALGPEMSRGLILIYVICCSTLFFLARIALRRLIWKLMAVGMIGQRVAIYGAAAGNIGRVAALLTLERLPYLKLVGFADDRKTRIDTNTVGDIKFLGGFDELLEHARTGDLDQVIIALPQIRQSRLDAIVERLEAAAIDVCILPREMLELRSGYRLKFLGDLPVLAVWQYPVRDFDGLIKVLQDKALALIGLVLLSPLLLLTAIAIKLESRGPVLFVQRRFGFNNVEIGVLKFRSMYHDKGDVSGAQRTIRNDARVTRVGRVIRRTSIDELPQLWNVLRGEMSLVGPRPHATAMKVGDRYYFDAVRNYGARHRVKPGITGLAQVRGLRGEIATVERAKRRVEYDIYYIEHWSPLLDMRIILETFVQLVWSRQAY